MPIHEMGRPRWGGAGSGGVRSPTAQHLILGVRSVKLRGNAAAQSPDASGRVAIATADKPLPSPTNESIGILMGNGSEPEEKSTSARQYKICPKDEEGISEKASWLS